jgi:hypothetical protein
VKGRQAAKCKTGIFRAKKAPENEAILCVVGEEAHTLSLVMTKI